jgi:hypothetical protein
MNRSDMTEFFNDQANQRFNDEIIDIGSRIFDLHILLSKFVIDLFSEMKCSSMQVDFLFPFFRQGKSCACEAKRVYLDHEDDLLKIELNDSDIVPWSDVDISIQEECANQIFTSYQSSHYLNYLEKPEPQH